MVNEKIIELDEKTYKRLEKDANDNRQVVRIVLALIIGALIAISIIVIAPGYFSLNVRQKNAELDNEIALAEARTNAQVLEIERGDMSMKDYIAWLEVRNK